jgi:RNA-directed DNA polymerase
VESKLEGKFGLEINREKTRVIDVRQESLDFLGYTFRYDRPCQGRRDTTYLNVVPSKQALGREREKLRTLIATNQSHAPLPQLVAKLNRHLEGWANYFCYGYPRGLGGRSTGSCEAV